MANITTPQSVRWGLAPETTTGTAITTMTKTIYVDGDPPINDGESLIHFHGVGPEHYQSSVNTHRGKYSPSLSGLSFPWNAYSVTDFLYNFFQGIAGESSQLKTFRSATGDYTPIQAGTAPGSGRPMTMTVTRGDSDASADDHALIGGVVSSLTVSGDTSGVIMCSVDMVGLDVDYDADHTAAVAAITTRGLSHPLVDFDGSAPSVITFFGAAAAVESFSITITNGATTSSYNAAAPRQITFGKMVNVSGDITIASDRSSGAIPTYRGYSAAQVAGTAGAFTISNDGATPDSAGDWTINSNVRIESISEDETDTGHNANISFTGVHGGSSGTNDDIEFIVHDGISNSWE